MTKYFIAICFFLLGLFWSVYCTLYYGWLTATPLEQGYLEVYQKSALYWLYVTGLLIVLIILCLLRMFVIYPKKDDT
ncbi:Unannotated [Lentimonas sp. CC4]|nr:Unannotated [Lentimonas sp. CC4]CAA6685757.1 Unannotated [Lentimonas sp. CC6]CAA7076231.1 Unannotated [Lentimonas sp. CC4]CAA7168716.1 Unannotated [Lentimonas sp. CC21]CAA7183455.1 Unannotated [Lentimonas sp. CC8]